MSYLNLPSFNVADSPKGTISLWFRVSNDSVQKALQHGNDYPRTDIAPKTFEIFRGTIPLVTFGKKQTGTLYDSVGYMDCRGESDENGAFSRVYSFHPVSPNDSNMEPSHIGLSCWGHGEGLPSLLIVLQTPNKPRAQGILTEVVECHYTPFAEGNLLYMTVRDVSYVNTGWPEVFYIEPDFEIKIDKWHHLIASWDLSTSVDVVASTASEGEAGDCISGSCKFYFAYDDKNKNGKENIGDACWAFKGPNDVVPPGAQSADFHYTPRPPPERVTGLSLNPEWHWQAGPLPLSGGPVGVPASAEYVDNVYHVEMAELQFFAGLVVDTGNEENRRVFIDYVKDSEGNLVKDKEGKNSLRPVDPKEAEQRFGRPHILLRTSANWQQGKNTGSVGLTRDDAGDNIIESGQFRPTGEIRRYKPDPSLQEVVDAEPALA